ncbi:MAG: hypothetical protein N2487_01730 [Verrucomicrobiae bacterium]|nr:hypothetical protein [Verrucomicrobiae bacterium]
MKIKILKFIIAILLLPFCAGGLRTLWFLTQALARADMVWVPIVAGFAAWLVIYALLPKPMRVYIFGHELTHAFWTVVFGGKVKGFKASAKGGHVVVTKSNFITYLAPYFFPIYAILVCAIYAVASVFLEIQNFRAIFHLLLGAAYAFHVTFTINVLQTKQTDISSQGKFFSWVIIAIGNFAVLIIGIPLLSGFSVLTSLKFWFLTSIHYYERIFSACRTVL